MAFQLSQLSSTSSTFFSKTFLHFSLPLARIDPLYPLKKLFLLTLALLLVKLSNLVYAIVKLI